MTKRLIIMLLFCLVVFGGVFFMKYMGNKGMQSHFDNMPVPPATISATEVKLSEWSVQLEAVGSLKAVNGIEVTTEAAGIVETIAFESGDRVEQGDILVTLDANTDRADLKTYEAQSRLAQTELKRLRELHKLDAVSQAELDRAESEAAQSHARVQSQKAKIAQKEIRAPFAGELGIRRVDLGQYVSPGTPIVSLQALNPLYVDFSLPEQQLSRVHPGQAVNIMVDLLPGETLRGQIQAVETRVDPATRNFPIRAILDNRDGRLRPGVFARVAIRLADDRPVVLVPRTAISYNAYGDSVFVIQEQPAEASGETTDTEDQPRLTVRQRFIKTGEARGDFIVIIEGLEAGERIATTGLLKLRNNQPVIINNELAPKVTQTPAPADT